MNRLKVLLLLLVSSNLSSAQDKEIESQIKLMDKRNSQAIVNADTIEFLKILAPQFTINRTTGTISSGRDKTLALMRQGMVTYDSFSVETEFVMVYSPTLAISMGNEVVVSGGNRELKGQTIRRRFTHTWVREKEGDDWRILARHANNVCTN